MIGQSYAISPDVIPGFSQDKSTWYFVHVEYLCRGCLWLICVLMGERKYRIGIKAVQVVLNRNPNSMEFRCAHV